MRETPSITFTKVRRDLDRAIEAVTARKPDWSRHCHEAASAVAGLAERFRTATGQAPGSRGEKRIRRAASNLTQLASWCRNVCADEVAPALMDLHQIRMAILRLQEHKGA